MLRWHPSCHSRGGGNPERAMHADEGGPRDARWIPASAGMTGQWLPWRNRNKKTYASGIRFGRQECLPHGLTDELQFAGFGARRLCDDSFLFAVAKAAADGRETVLVGEEGVDDRG